MTSLPSLTLVVADSAPGPLQPAFFTDLEEELCSGLLEVLVVSSSEPPLVSGAPKGVRWLSSPGGATVPERRGRGLAAARAPIVALTESFCVPAPGWAQAVLTAHAEHHVAAVGGPVDRREGTAADWGLTLLEYGRFLGPEPAGPVGDLPGINVSYRIERVVRALGSLPARVVEVEVHSALVRAGETLWREPGAVMFDGSRMSPGAARRAQFLHGRFYGGHRVAGRGALHRLARLTVAPAVPLVLGRRIVRGALRAGRGRILLRALPHLGGLLTAWAAGEAAGSLFGAGRSGERWT